MIFNSLRVQLVMLMSWRTLLNLKTEISAFVTQNTEIFTHSSTLKLLNILFNKSNRGLLLVHIRE